MPLSKDKADQFFNEHEGDFEAMTRLFLAAAETGDLGLVAYIITSIERVATLTLQAMRQDQKPDAIAWQ